MKGSHFWGKYMRGMIMRSMSCKTDAFGGNYFKILENCQEWVCGGDLQFVTCPAWVSSNYIYVLMLQLLAEFSATWWISIIHIVVTLMLRLMLRFNESFLKYFKRSRESQKQLLALYGIEMRVILGFDGLYVLINNCETF